MSTIMVYYNNIPYNSGIVSTIMVYYNNIPYNNGILANYYQYSMLLL
jgi:hypothetical protein